MTQSNNALHRTGLALRGSPCGLGLPSLRSVPVSAGVWRAMPIIDGWILYQGQAAKEDAAMENESDFCVGFWFGLFVAKSLGFEAQTNTIYDQFRSVARGDLTLMPSPADVFHDIEANVGRPLTESERNLARSCIPTNRVEQDAANRERATTILRLMGQST